MDKVGISMNDPFLKKEKDALFVKGIMNKKMFVDRRDVLMCRSGDEINGNRRKGCGSSEKGGGRWKREGFFSGGP